LYLKEFLKEIKKKYPKILQKTIKPKKPSSEIISKNKLCGCVEQFLSLYEGCTSLR